MASSKRRSGTPVRYKNDLFEVLAWDGDYRTKDHLYGQGFGKMKAVFWTREEAKNFAEKWMNGIRPIGDHASVTISETWKSGDTFWHERWSGKNGAWYRSDPIAVSRAYPRKRALQADLTRYYEDCVTSKTAKRFKGQRRKSYCGGVAWKRMHMAGRYKDYAKYRGKKANPLAFRESDSADYGYGLNENPRDPAKRFSRSLALLALQQRERRSPERRRNRVEVTVLKTDPRATIVDQLIMAAGRPFDDVRTSTKMHWRSRTVGDRVFVWRGSSDETLRIQNNILDKVPHVFADRYGPPVSEGAHEQLNENPVSVVGTVLGLGVVAALGIGAYLFFRSKQSGSQAITLQPGSMAIHGNFVGAQVAIGLPQGNWSWVDLTVDGMKQSVLQLNSASSGSPATVYLTNPSGVITATWAGWATMPTVMAPPITNTATISYGA